MFTRYAVFLVLFFLFILEGTVYQVFAPDFHGSPYHFIPRWLFIMILLSGIYRGKGHGLLYGIIFGMLYDIVYGQVLGVYTFGMGLLAYLLSISKPFMMKNISMTFLTVMTGTALLEYYVYGMMTLLGLTVLQHEVFLSMRFIPTMLMNGSLLLILIIPLRYWFQYLENKLNELN